MKKTITILLIITITCTLLPMRVYASNQTSENTSLNYEPEAFNQLMDSGEATVGGKTKFISEAFSIGTAVLIIIVSFLSLLPTTINGILSLITMGQQEPEEGKKWEVVPFTIGNTVLGKIDLFNIDFFNFSSSSNTDSDISIFKDSSQGGVNKTIKETVANWYMGIRNLAIILNLLVLIYMGIRMALSTVASDKARYKGMLIDWVVSLALIFVLHYVILIFMSMANIIMKIVVPSNAGEIIQKTEGTIIKNLLLNMTTSTNWNVLLAFITYVVFTVYNIKFFLLYAKRLISTAFLIIIAPLITVTYAIDRAGDKKAQALGTWLSELLVNIFIQPLHAILYLVFMFSAANIVRQAPILTVVLFMALSRGEKIVKEMFKMRGRRSINSMSAYLPIKGK